MQRTTILLLAAVLSLAAQASKAATGVFREQVISGLPAGATEVVRGPDGGFWFTEFDGNRIGSISRDGHYREFNVPTPDSGPRGIAASFDAIWFTEFKAGKVGRLTPAGVFTEYVLPSPQSRPWGITVASASAIWFTESNANKIGRIAVDGTVTEFLVPSPSSGPRGIASGNFGLPCFTEFSANQVACMDGDGRILERPLPTSNSGPESMANMTNHGDVWFTEALANRIGVIRFVNARTLLDARVEEFPIPTTASVPSSISADYYAGSAWFTEKSAGQLGFISSEGRITEYPLKDRSSQPTGIFVDIGVWFLESAANRFVEIEPDAVLVAGAGSSGSWQTEFRLANVENLSVTAFAGVYPAPVNVCGVCIIPEAIRKLPPNGSVAIGAPDQFRLGGLNTVFVRVLEDGILPSVKARIFNANIPSQSVDLPSIRLSRLTDLNPSLLSFPGAMKTGAAHSNLWLAEASMREPLNVVVEVLDTDGNVVGSRGEMLDAGRSRYLIDVIGTLGIVSLRDGQVRVRKTSDRGLLWGYLATVNADGAVSISAGLNP